MRRYRLSINQCPEHKSFYSIHVDDGNGQGTRVTGSKCCGRWHQIMGWTLNERDWRRLAELANEAADACIAAAPRQPSEGPAQP